LYFTIYVENLVIEKTSLQFQIVSSGRQNQQKSISKNRNF